MKTCYACNAEKPLTEFRKARSDSGYSAKCSQCWLDECGRAAVRRREERQRMLVAAGGKVCSRCRCRLSPSLYKPRAASADGLNSFCAGCDLKRGRDRREQPGVRLELCSKAKIHYWKNPERARARAKRYTTSHPELSLASCRKHNIKRRTEKWAEVMVHGFRSSYMLAKRGPTDIDSAYLRELLANQNGRCYWLGLPIVMSAHARDPRRPSADRIDNSKGYVRGNVVIACHFANMGRSNMTAEQFRVFIEELRSALVG